MTERWWAPQRPTVEPDAVVLAMLEPGDLGAAFMAAHRAGAAAIETVSKGVLPSEQKLIDAMVTARRNVAPKVVDSISKNLDGSYAGLLVRDVLDDAELAALAVYRAAVSKGVSPPAAADRAAAVYGVPAKQLGKYMTLATDPRVNPVTLNDAADRTLLTYASRLAESEVQTVSKADPPRRGGQQYQEWDPREHPRDASGRFADAPDAPKTQTGGGAPPKAGSLEWLRAQLGLGSGEPQRVAELEEQKVEEKVEEKRPERVRRPQRARRARRERRPTRAQPGQLEPTQLTPMQLTPKQLEGALQQQAIFQAAMRADNAAQIEAELEERGISKPGTEIVPRAAEIPDLMKPVQDKGNEDTYFPLVEALTIVGNNAELEPFLQKLYNQTGMQRDNSRMIFRMGYLLDASSDPEKSGSEYLDQMRGGQASYVTGEADSSVPGYLEPEVEFFHPHDVGMSGLTRNEYRRKREQDEVSTTWTDDEGRRYESVDQQEKKFVKAMPVYTPPGELTTQDVLVHWKAADPDRPNQRPKPTVDEFVIVSLGRDVYGRAEGETHTAAGDHSYYRLDPNQAYELVNNPAGDQSTVVHPDQMWDSEHKVMVNRWYIRPIEEYEVEQVLGTDVEKADDQQFMEAQHPRDTHGRFVDAQHRVSGITVGQAPIPVQIPEQVEERPTERVRRVTRPQRARRVSRPRRETQPTQALQPRQLEAEPLTAQLQPKPMKATPFQQALNEARLRSEELRPTRRDRELPALSDAWGYKVMTEHQWSDLMTGVADEDIIRLHAGEQIPLNSYVDRIFRKHNNTHADSITYKLAGNLDEDPSIKSAQHQIVHRMPVRDARDLHALADVIQGVWDKHPEADRIEMIRRNNLIEMSINVAPVGAQSIIEFDPDVVDDPEEHPNLYMSYVGEFKASELGVQNSQGDIEALVSPTGTAQNGEGVVINSPVHLYRISTRRYRVAPRARLH